LSPGYAWQEIPAFKKNLTKTSGFWLARPRPNPEESAQQPSQDPKANWGNKRSCSERKSSNQMKRFDSLTSEAGNAQIGRKVVVGNDEPVGTLSGVWLDPSTHRVEFVGVKANGLFKRTHLIPASTVQLDEAHGSIKVPYTASFIENAPEFNPDHELAEVEKQQVTAYYGFFVPIRRTSAIEEIRPQEAIDPASLPTSDKFAHTRQSGKSRTELERDEQRFFKQKGFVTEAMAEVNAAEELKRTQREARIRQKEDM
jgi:hypothetical protein